MESFRGAVSNETCFSLYLRKRKLFIQLFWLLRFTVVARKNTFFVEFLLPWKKQPEKNSEKQNKTKQNKAKSNFSLKISFFVNVSCKETNLKYTLKVIYSSICNILLLPPFRRYDQLKWERQMTVIFGRKFSFSAGNVLKPVQQYRLAKTRII